MTAQEKLSKKFEEGLHICVGLDSDINKIPKHLLKLENPILEFNKQLIDETKAYTAAYKINFAFYEKEGIQGWNNLRHTLELIPDDILVIGDARRGDIGNTSKMYAVSVYDHLGFDSITLNPYMGKDSIEPFLKYKDKLSFILALTSNKSAFDFEKLRLENGQFLFQRVIEKIKSWNDYENLGLVFGATNQLELKENIVSFQEMPVLLPGVGAQGGSLEDVVALFSEVGNRNYLINVSRGIIYSDSTDNFAKAAAESLKAYNNRVKINYK